MEITEKNRIPGNNPEITKRTRNYNKNRKLQIFRQKVVKKDPKIHRKWSKTLKAGYLGP